MPNDSDGGVKSPKSANSTGTAPTPSRSPTNGPVSPSSSAESPTGPVLQDADSRVFSTREVVQSAMQLKVHSVTMHADTSRLLSPRRRRRRPREFKAMLRQIRHLNIENDSDNANPNSINSNPCEDIQ